MYPKILTDILDCNKCSLKKTFDSEFHSVTFYYTEANAKSCRYIMILQNPGIPKNWKKRNEYKALLNTNRSKFIDISQEYLYEWLYKKNYNFSEKFFSALKRNNLINYNDLELYLKGQFFSDFLFMDLVKCRADTAEIRDLHIDTCTENYLQKEIEVYGKNKLIFAFSSRTWEHISYKFIRGLKPEERKVSNVHGLLFRSDTLPAHFIPLAHFSQRQYNNYLRNSYFEYLDEGLKKYSALV